MGRVLELLIVLVVSFLNSFDKFLQLFGVKLMRFDKVGHHCIMYLIMYTL